MYACTDVETSGFDSLRNQVITLSTYIVDADFNLMDEFHTGMRPEGKKSIVWSDGAEKVHGITWQEAISYPPALEAANNYLDFLAPFGPLTFVAHNMPYDRRMIKGTLSRYDKHFDFYQAFPTFQDTIKLLKESGLVSGKSKSLGAVCKELGIDHDHHNAKSDAFVLIEILKRCKQKGNDAQTLDGDYELQGEEYE